MASYNMVDLKSFTCQVCGHETLTHDNYLRRYM